MQGREMKVKCRLLVVDDYAPIRSALRNLLESYDDLHVVGEATNRQEAIQRAASCQPDVILMDMNMPIMNGIHAASEIKKCWNNTIIIGLVAVTDPEVTNAFIEAGASSVIAKDKCDDLFPTIRKACRDKFRGSRRFLFD
jgi:DNA-binding NarL/FixJ family response regulator